MHEYSLCGINVGLDSAHSIVLCKIAYDSSKPCTVNLKSGTKIAEIINTNLEGTSSVTTQNLTYGDVDDRSAATQFQFQDVNVSCADFDFNELGSESFCLGDLGDLCLSFDYFGDLGDVDACPCADVDRIMECLHPDPQEEPVEENNISNLGKRKFEA
ncbi:hypothetical protein POM88_007930 [Heracleum sosnowskyi]|uniref:Uncharacterized protein n=1 Tax=Heracleum sosnowskyi TaxID=360622 RepID=A0AAD8J8X7_9APIA|nr:hypothetical protein POM88_007930 [Heracleum sosnowskyi]